MKILYFETEQTWIIPEYKDDDANGARISLPLFLIIILRLFDAMKTSHSPQLCLINWSNEDILFLTIEHSMIGTWLKWSGKHFTEKQEKTKMYLSMFWGK